MASQQVKQLLVSLHPTISEMAFMRELTAGKFQRQEILRSEIVELYRALDTREKIQNIYKNKLSEGVKQGLVTKNDLSLMEEVIDDFRKRIDDFRKLHETTRSVHFQP